MPRRDPFPEFDIALMQQKLGRQFTPAEGDLFRAVWMCESLVDLAGASIRRLKRAVCEGSPEAVAEIVGPMKAALGALKRSAGRWTEEHENAHEGNGRPSGPDGGS